MTSVFTRVSEEGGEGGLVSVVDDLLPLQGVHVAGVGERDAIPIPVTLPALTLRRPAPQGLKRVMLLLLTQGRQPKRCTTLCLL